MEVLPQPAMSRRSMLKIVGGATAGLLSISADPAFAGTPSPGTAAEAIHELFSRRAACGTGADLASVVSLYDPSSRGLIGYERERARAIALLGSAWQGHVESMTSSPTICSMETTGNTVRARVYDLTEFTWWPAPRPLTPSEQALRAADPAKFGIGPQAEPVRSAFGVPHELTLVGGQGRWRVAADNYTEPILLGASPDLVPGSWADVNGGRRPNGALTAPRTVDVAVAAQVSSSQEDTLALAATASGIYDYTAAVNYALIRYNNYLTSYCNYNACGGDCANFVSQCFRAGAEASDGTWGTHSGACGACGKTSGNAGSTAWVNNASLRSWAIAARRGIASSGITVLGYGDIVNYDWNGDGVTDHVAIVTDPINHLVTAHNADVKNAYWTLGSASSYQYTTIWLYYPG